MLLLPININAGGSKKGKKEAKQAKIFCLCCLFLPVLLPFRSGIFRQCDISRRVAKCRDRYEISREFSPAELKREAGHSHNSLRFTAFHQLQVITGWRIAFDPCSTSIFSEEILMTPDEIIANQLDNLLFFRQD
jgi:hypothetical protein